MVKRFGFNKLLISLLILTLCVAMIVPALAYDPSTLCNGSRGEEVRALQRMLIDLGYLKGEADGIFGNQTEKAVRRFQWKNGLKADGVAGPKTLAKLYAGTGNKAAESTPSPAPDTRGTRAYPSLCRWPYPQGRRRPGSSSPW